jgi:hypothetical protein
MVEKMSANRVFNKLLSRAMISAIAAVSLSLCLSGCDPARPAQISLKVDGGNIIASTCEAISVERINVYAETAEGVDLSWKAEGRASWNIGDEFQLFQDSLPGLKVAPGSRIADTNLRRVTLYVTGAPDGDSVYDLSNLDPNEWLRWDGSVSPRPCP